MKLTVEFSPPTDPAVIVRGKVEVSFSWDARPPDASIAEVDRRLETQQCYVVWVALVGVGSPAVVLRRGKGEWCDAKEVDRCMSCLTLMIRSIPICCSSVTSEMLSAPNTSWKLSGSSRSGSSGAPMNLEEMRTRHRKSRRPLWCLFSHFASTQ